MTNRLDKGGSVPKLRFPEFRDGPKWQESTVGELVTTIAPPQKIPTTNYLAKGLFPIVDQSQQFISGWTNDQSAIIVDDFPLIIFGDHTCAVKLISEPFAQGADGIKILKTKPAIKAEFLYQFIQFEPVRMEEYKRHFSIFKERKVMYPGIKTGEQQEIANCLSSIDEIIGARAQELAALKSHKNGLMRQLFPAEGETVPKLRFPEFRNSGSWVSSSLGEIAKITSGGTPSRSNGAFWNGNIPWVTTSLIAFNTILETDEFISDLGLAESATKIFPKNAILMAMYGQGKTRGKVAILGIRAATNQACAAILIKEKIDTSFLFQNLAARYDEIRTLSNAGGQENLSTTLIESIPFKYPNPETNEQRKIGDCLSSLDDLIFAKAQEIESLKAHKNGLMQQLFPSANEVCG